MPPASPQSVEDEVDIIVVIVVESVVKESLVVAVYLNREVEEVLGDATMKEVMVLGDVEIEDEPVMVKAVVTTVAVFVVTMIVKVPDVVVPIIVVMAPVMPVVMAVVAPVVAVLMLMLMILALEEVIFVAFGHMVRNTSLPPLLHPPLCVAWPKRGAAAQINIPMPVGMDGLAVVAEVCAAPDAAIRLLVTCYF